MTKEELIEMTGSNEQADLAVQLLLKSIKRPMVEMVIKAELDEINTKLEGYRILGIVVKDNGTERVDWSKPYEAYGDEPGAAFHATEEQEKKYEMLSKHCQKADALLCYRNRVNSLWAVR